MRTSRKVRFRLAAALPLPSAMTHSASLTLGGTLAGSDAAAQGRPAGLRGTMMRSVDRVREAAKTAGLAIDIRTMPDTTRTAEEAAAACGVGVGQIVKSLVF